MVFGEYIKCDDKPILSSTATLTNSICAALCQEDADYLADDTVHESKQTGWLSELSVLREDEMCICLSRSIDLPNATPDYEHVRMYIYPEAFITGSSMSVVLVDTYCRYSRAYFETILGYQYGPPVTGGVMNAGYYLNESEMKRVAAIKNPFDRFMAFLHLVERFSTDVTEYLRDCCKGMPTKTLFEMYKEREADRMKFNVKQY